MLHNVIMYTSFTYCRNWILRINYGDQKNSVHWKLLLYREVPVASL